MAQQPLNHDYYYGNEADQYTFYRLPKALFTKLYNDLSDGPKILYGLMLDRMGLSIRNGWTDENNRVYIYFTLEDLQEYMNCGHNKGVKLLAELENKGLIERIKQGQGKPTKICVKKFFADDSGFNINKQDDVPQNTTESLLNHGYYYGSEADQYTFYRLPKALFADRYKNLSDGSKILYGLMLDRMGLSAKNGWRDANNRVYIFFTLEDIQKHMKCGHNKGSKLLTELENIGLIERVKQGQGKPTKVFVKKFITNDGDFYNKKKNSYSQDYSTGNQDFPKEEAQTSENDKSRYPINGNQDFPKEETRTSEIGRLRLPINGSAELSKEEVRTSENEKSRLLQSGSAELSKAEVQTSENGKSRLPYSGSADFPKADTNKNYINQTEINKTDVNNINLIKSYQNKESSPAPQTGPDKIDEIDEIKEIITYREMIKDNIEYDCLCHRYGKERMDEVVELLTATITSKQKYTWVSKDNHLTVIIRKRLLKLNQFHIEYVFDSIDKSTTKMHNVKQYLLSSLHNALMTMDTHYINAVNHDMHGSD